MRPTPRTAGRLLPFLAALAAAVVTTADLRAQPALTCEACHGELELLRQHAPTLDEAREIHVPGESVAASAHGGMDCTDCHTGYRRFPHGSAVTTASCTACHSSQLETWEEGIHAVDGNADCRACHGVHDVLTVQQMREPAGTVTMRAACASCHFEPRTPEDDPHAQAAACHSCHEPHRTLGVGNPEASIHPLKQVETCGACHDTLARTWRGDVHGTAVSRLATLDRAVSLEEVEVHLEPPSCTGCHGAHGMLTPTAADFPQRMAERCSHCHEEFAESFADSYHGQATELGSGGVATCYHCHGAHDVLPAADDQSRVNESNLLGTCASCHPAATAGFTQFQPHADHNDREKYPMVYWSYHLMTALLIGVFTVFGAHTALWLVRLGLDAVRGGSGHVSSDGD